MENKYGCNDVFLITNGIDLNKFHNENKMLNDTPRILLMYHELELKGVKDALKAIELVKNKHPNIKLVMFGTKNGKERPDDAEFHLKPTPEELRQLYCRSDIFIFPSRSEGYGLPPMEAMACKCAVVASNVGGIPDYTIKNETALIFEPKDIQTMAQHIIYLVEHPEELKRISYAGFNHIKQFTWEKATEKMEAIFREELAKN